MSNQATRYIADFDSASAMLRALSHFLHGKDFPALGLSRSLEPFAKAVNWLPESLREKVFALGGFFEAIPPKKIGEVSADAVARWMVSQYPQRRYPAVMIGSSNGALMHLCAALQVPWLPQTYLIPVRQSVDPDEPKKALEIGREPGKRLLEANPDLQLHHMHDPNQDRLMVRHMTYFRVKRRCLGQTYERFLSESLDPGGTIFLVDCRLRWSTTRVGERHVFQHGAMGGLPEEEFLQGSARVERFLERQGSHRRQWDEPVPDIESPEAEWGFEPSLGEDVERFARQHGYRIRRIVFEEPEDPSPLVADLYRWWYQERGLSANRLLVESFILVEPWWTLRSGAVPFWMVFNKEPSAQALERYLTNSDPYDYIYLMLFAHGVESVGLPPIEHWRALINRARKQGEFIGVDEKAYPRDFAAFARYYTELRKIPGRNPLPGPLSLDQLDRFLEQAGNRYSVSWQEYAP